MVIESVTGTGKTDYSIPRTLCQDLLIKLCEQKLWGKMCDVQFFYGKSLQWAHSCVLASFSPFLMRFFVRYLDLNDVQWSVRTPFKIHISVITKCLGKSKNNCMDCVCKVIDFIYTGKIKLNPPHLDHIVNISSNLEIENLILICQKYRNDTKDVHTSLVSDGISVSIGKECDSNPHSSKNEDIDITKTETGSEACCNNNTSTEYMIQFVDTLLNKSDENVPLLNVNKHECSNTADVGMENFKEGNFNCVYDHHSLPVNEVHNAVHDSVHANTEPFCEMLSQCDGISNKRSSDTRLATSCQMTECVSLSDSNRGDNNSPVTVTHDRSLEDRAEDIVSEICYSREHSERTENVSHSCKHCNASFTNSSRLRQHEQIYHTRKFLCLYCNFTSFKLVYILKHLMESNHGDNVCSICLYEAVDDIALKKHFEDHKHSLPFLCCVCSERFKTRTDWNRHMATHSNERPFVCKLCNIVFKKCSYLQNHILTHHKKPKHLCELCGYTTPFKSFLMRHKLKHSEKKLNCPISSCSFETARETNLKQHLKTHKAEKPFKCSICNVLFSQNKNLRRHIQLAHNPHVTVFECPGCSYMNTRFDKVKEHICNIHSKDKSIMEKINEQYETVKRNQTSRVIPKYKRSHSNQKSYIKLRDSVRRKEINTNSNNSIRENDKANLNMNAKTNEFILGKDEVCIPSRPLLSTFVNTSDIMPNSADCILEGSNSINSLTEQTVLLSEATGEIAIMTNREGEPIPVASLTSTNLLTIGNFREGTGSVTLNEATGVLTLNNINSESTGAVFLNESTGELSYINLNQENCNSVQEKADNCETDKLAGMNYTREFATLLNEVTGEISTVQEDTLVGNGLNFGEDDMFDSFDIDVFNEDSFDGFDEFDGYLFDSLNPSGVENESTMENFLNEFTGELLQDSTTNIPQLNEVSTSIKNIQNHDLSQNIWNPVCSHNESLDINLSNTHNVLDQTLLNEVTGEFFKSYL